MLIILAGVAINLTLGDNGIFNKAKYARSEYLNSKGEEDTKLAQATNEIDSVVESTRENGPKQYAYFKMSKNQVNNSGIAIVEFDSTSAARGLALDSNNSVQLKAGKVYKISFGFYGNSSVGRGDYAVYDNTNSKFVSSVMATLGVNHGSAWNTMSHTECIYVPSNDCSICIKNSDSLQYCVQIISSTAYWLIEEI